MTAEGYDSAAFDAFEAAAWGRSAERYDEFAGRVTALAVEPLLDAAGVGPGTRLVDAATGTGVVAAAAAARGAEAVGVDVAPAMVELARAAHPQVEFVEATVYDLPFPDGAFDAAVCSFGIQHVGRPDDALAELVRVLAPGGRLGLTVWDAPARSRLHGVFLEAVAASGAGRPPGLPAPPPMFQLTDPGAAAALLTDAGLAGVEARTVAWEVEASGVDEIWDGLLQGGVLIRALVEGLDAAAVRTIRALVEEGFEPYRAGQGFSVPTAVVVAAGRKP